MKFKYTKTPRGFALITFQDYYKQKCSLQKSSLAEPPAIWFGITDIKPKILASTAKKLGIETDETTGCIEYPLPSGVMVLSRMHLSLEQVKELIPILQHFVDTGEITHDEKEGK